jgi:hypothetical protein
MHGDRFLGWLNVDVGSGRQPGEQWPELTGSAGDGHPDAQVARRGDGTGDDLRRSMITAHGVDGDHSGRGDLGSAIMDSRRRLVWPGVDQLGGGGWRWGGAAQRAAARLVACVPQQCAALSRAPVSCALVARVPVSRMPPSFSLCSCRSDG